MSERVLLVVDMLNDFIRKDGALYCGEGAEKIVPFVAGKVQEFVSQGLPVIFIIDAHDPQDLEFKRFPPHCIYGSEGSDVIRELKSLVEEYSFAIRVPKSRYSGFFRTNLNEVLRDLKPKTVEVVGVCTHICVLYTVEELCNRDYEVIVHREGVASYDQEAHRWAIRQMTEVLGARVC
ncbi:MAG: cysteine hydrolase [Peptococcaceae bacterium]|nr:cysteine hydrolase [Peptococcaceae bacterium]